MRKQATSTRRGQFDAKGVLARAALLRLIAQGFGYPVPCGALAVRRAFARLDDARRRGAFDARLDAGIERAKRAWREAGERDLQAEYMRLFHGAGSVPLRETAYGDGCRPAGRPVEIADLCGFYLAFGLEPSEANPDMPDHVSVEAEFLSLLLLKEVYAHTGRLRPEQRVVGEAARAFLEDHLGRWSPALRAKLAEERAAPPYRALGDLLAMLISAECRRLGARPSPLRGRVRADEMQAEGFICPQAARPNGLDCGSRLHSEG